MRVCIKPRVPFTKHLTSMGTPSYLPTVRVQTSRWALVLLLLAAAVPAIAQRHDARSALTLPTAYGVGTQQMEFSYLNPRVSVLPYRVDRTFPVVSLTSDAGSLMFTYAKVKADSITGFGYEFVSAQLNVGGNSWLFRSLLGIVPVGAYVPIRLNVGYQMMVPEEDRVALTMGGMPLVVQTDPLHLLSAGLAVGAGVAVRIPTPLPILEDNVNAYAHVLWGAGVAADLQQGVEDVYAAGSRELSVEIRIDRLIANRLGVMVGYSRYERNTSREPLEKATEVWDAFKAPDDLPNRFKAEGFRIGVTL